MPAVLLGTCGVGWSSEVRSLQRGALPHSESAVMLRSVSGIGLLLAVGFYGLLFSFIQHSSVADYALGDVAVAVGLSVLIAVTVGVMGMVFMRMVGRDGGEFLVVLLGVVSFVAGCASSLGYSPLFVGMLCGVVIVNLPGGVLDRFKRVIVEAEQPMAMVLMLVAGVMADPMIGIYGVLLVFVLVVVRLVIKLGVMKRRLEILGDNSDVDPLLWIGPIRQSPLAIALAVGYALALSSGGGGGALADMVSGGVILTVVILVGLMSDAIPLFFLMKTRDGGGGAMVEGGEQ